jgi:hypothetical protein
MTEYTKGQRVRVLRDSTSSHIEPGTIVTLLDQVTNEFWTEWGGKYWFTDDTSGLTYIGAIVSEDDIEPVEEPEDKFKPGDRVDWVYEDGRERANGYWSNVIVEERDDFAGGGEAYVVRRENGDTGLIAASELRLHQDVVPEGYEEVDVDRPEVGDIVTFTYLATDEVFTTTVHYGLSGLEMLGWGFFEVGTFDDIADVADIEVTRVLRKVVPEPEPETGHGTAYVFGMVPEGVAQRRYHGFLRGSGSFVFFDDQGAFQYAPPSQYDGFEPDTKDEDF